MNHPDIRVHEITAAAGQRGVQSSEPYVAINQDAQFRLSRAMNKNYTGGPEPDPKATAEEKSGKNCHHRWRSKICDAAFDRAISKQHLHKYGEEWVDDDERKVSHLTVDQLITVDEKYPVRYVRSATDNFLTEFISGVPTVFKSNSESSAESNTNGVIEMYERDESAGGLLIENQISGISDGGVGKFSNFFKFKKIKITLNHDVSSNLFSHRNS